MVFIPPIPLIRKNLIIKKLTECNAFSEETAKTFKEAQSKVSFLSMISLIPMFTDMMNVDSNVLYMIPIASGGTILNDIFLKGLTTEHMLIFIATSIIVTVIALFVVSIQYKDEKALF